MLARRRGVILKAVLAVPFIWFSFIGFTVVMFGAAPQQVYEENPRFAKALAGDGDLEVNHQEVKADQIRLEERMRLDAAQELRNQEEMMRGQRMDQEHIAKPDMFNEGLLGGLGGVMKPFRDLAANHRQEAPTEAPSHVRLPPIVEEHHDPNGPGENGEAIEIDKEKLSPEERKLYDDGFQNNAFNQYASDMMSLHRTLPDTRDPACKAIAYPPPSRLPDTSVIICFHNEAWSILIRTVYSVLDRSPPELVREVLLVDDFSDKEHLKDQLDQKVAEFGGKVKVIRAKRREGLIRARLLGAAAARGQVLTFLDSHCECTIGWLEPLLYRISQNKTHVVTPVIDVIDDQTLRYQYSAAKSTSVGGFDWNLQFNWHSMPLREKARRQSDADPVRSPTMAGGLFSISREYFEQLGSYDPGMDIWGGENLELSFRTWMCGGTLEILPCSHVGHIFRKRSPYSWKTGVNVVKKNSIRLAEVWMDEYKHYYYERFNNDLGDYGDVSSRVALREKLQCKPFSWFIDNVYPELFIPSDAIASGEIRNKAQAQCLDSSVDHHSMNKAVKMWPCHGQGGNQFWMLSETGEIRRDEGCMDYAGKFLMIYPCHSMKGNQEWVYGADNTLRHRNTNLCVEMGEDGKAIEMKPCTGVDAQIWLWARKDNAADGGGPPRKRKRGGLPDNYGER